MRIHIVNVLIGVILSIVHGFLWANGLKINFTPPTIFSEEATLTISNDKHYSQVIKIDLFNQRNKDEVVARALVTVPANDNITQKVSPLVGKKISQELQWYYVHGVGDLTKKANSQDFKIPFETNVSSIVCQFPHGKNPAIDFCVPIGTLVLAAKSGVVIWVVDEHGDGGPEEKYFNKANLVEIMQEDGSRALYTHLQKGTIIVKAGDKISAGDILGRVGISGQTSGPHLHFHVVKLNEQMQDEYIEPSFVSDDGKSVVIKEKFTISRNSSVPPVQEVVRQAETEKKPQAQVTCGNISGSDNQKAIDCLSKGQLEQAIFYLTAHTSKNPNDALALARLATQYTHLGRHEEAIPAYKNAIKKNWISYDFASLYAKSLFATGNKEEAIKWNMRSISLAPDCVSCRQELATQLKDMGRSREALKLLQDYNESQKAKGKREYFQGIIMLLEDELGGNNGKK